MHTRNDRTWKHRIAGLVMAVVSLLMVASAPAAELLVSSEATDQVLRYDGTTGAFLGAFVTAGSGGLDSPGPGLRARRHPLRQQLRLRSGTAL